MSEGQSTDNVETLFVFELLVENIRVEKETEISGELALAVRLLDFPTLLIYPHKKENAQQADKPGEYSFNKGKTCFFQMNLNSLHTRLSSSPLYAMVLDVKEEIPKLVGSSLISLVKVMGRILQDVAQNGISVPSSRGERGLVSMCSLTGEKIGFISLSYKLLSVGTGVQGQQPVEECMGEKNMVIKPSSFALPQPTSFQNIALASGTTWKREESLNPAAAAAASPAAGESVAIQCRPRSQTAQTFKEIGNSFDGEMNIFCPPQLYYSHSGEDKGDSVIDYKQISINPDFNTFEELCSGHEVSGNKAGVSPNMDNREICVTKTEKHQQTNEVSPNVDALKQLPLLNALLMELSQLNVQNPHQPLSIHPNLAWIYRPASTEPPGGHDITPRKTIDKTKVTSSLLKNVHSSRTCTATGFKPTTPQRESKHKAAIIESKTCDKPVKSKLVYGTTKTFNLRLKKISTHKVKHDCTELLQNEKQITNNPKGKARPLDKPAYAGLKKLLLNKNSTLDKHGETVIQKVKMKSPLQETTTYVRENSSEKEEKDLPVISGIPSPPLGVRNVECIHIPSVDSDTALQSTERTENLGEPAPSSPPSLRLRESIKSPGSSKFSSRKSSFSDSTVGANKELEYADDFNSPEPSDVYSPDPGSTSELSRVHTPKSSVRPDSCSPDSVSHRKRTVLPVPPKAPVSPQRSLRSHIIRPQTPASVVSFSSGDCDRDSLASLQTIGSRREVTETGRAESSLVAESLGSLRSESFKNRSPGRGSESVSSVEPQDAEEEKDELGSLDLGREHQHISELLVNKLPGYTM